MSKRLRGINPFYVLLVLVGIVFVITAVMYGIMTVRMMRPFSPTGPGPDAAPHPLIALMDEHGLQILMVELAILAVATFAAIFTDGYWTGETSARREQRQSRPNASESANRDPEE